MATGKDGSGSKAPELRVVLETSSLYTGSASDLLSQEVAELIRQSAQHADLTVKWYIPDIVVQERQYQMIKVGVSLLPSIQKLEKLFGHNLNITEDVVRTSVLQAVERQIEELGLQIHPLGLENVEWKRLVQDAVYRQPPFDPGESEKGFRDALIGECFMQLVTRSPGSSKTCRIALVTGDKLLTEAVSRRTADAKNVRILASIEELKGLISTLVSEVSEEFVKSIQDRAREYFFTEGSSDDLFRRENVRKRVLDQYRDQLAVLPPEATRRQNGTWWISAPRFVKKERQRVHWATRIRVEAKAYKRAGPTFADSFARILAGLASQSAPSLGSSASEASQAGLPTELLRRPTIPSSLQSASSGNVAGSEPALQDTLLREGETEFEVQWSVVVTTRRNFTKPKIEAISLIGTTWA